MERDTVGKAERVAGKLLTCRGQNKIVSARKRGFDAELRRGFLNHAELAHEVVMFLRQQEREVQVAEIVEHSSPAARPPREFAAFAFQ